MNHFPDISFVIVNYNSGEKVDHLVSDILSCESNVEIVIVDNNSQDNSKDIFKELNKSRIRFVYNAENIGYGAANNIAAALASSEYLVFINPDASIPTGQRLNSFFINLMKTPGIGMIAPKICYPSGLPQPNFSKRYSTLSTFVAQLLSLGKIYRFFKQSQLITWCFEKIGSILFKAAAVEYTSRFKDADSLQDCSWVSGACFCVKKDDFLRIGGFDERFFLYSEDEDLCRRFKLDGLRILYSPDLIVLHEVGGTLSNSKFTVGELGVGSFHRILSGLIYILKYNDKKHLITKFVYISVSIVRLLCGLQLFVSPRRCSNLISRMIKL